MLKPNKNVFIKTYPPLLQPHHPKKIPIYVHIKLKRRSNGG